MKQTLRRIMSIALMMVCVLALTACGSAAKTEDSGIDESLSANMITTAEGLNEAIVVLSGDDIASYKESGDAFTTSAMEAWEANKDDLGEYKSMGTSTVDEITDGYSVTTPVEFSKRNAEMVYTFDEEGTPTALAINPEYTLGEKMVQALMNTLMGVGIVFVILIFLSFLISLFRYIPKLQEKLENKNKADAPAVAETANTAVKATPAPVAGTDDAQFVAVIAAAIAAAEGTSTDSFVVRSIKKINRKKW